MTPAEFAAWRRATGFSQRAAAAALGLSLPTVQAYERGALFQRDAEGEERPAVIPRVVELACAWLKTMRAPSSTDNSARSRGPRRTKSGGSSRA